MRKRPASLSFLPPEKYPLDRLTPHGVKMSPRMSRIYGWLNANGIALSPFSTDDHVETHFPRLVQAKAHLEGLPSSKEIADMIGDLTCIMRRRPATRVKGVRS